MRPKSEIIHAEGSRYTPDVDVVPHGATVHCGLCGSKMNEHRKITAPRGFAQAMCRDVSTYDEFICPYYSDQWHEQADKLYTLANQTPSKTLAGIYREDAEEIVRDTMQSVDFKEKE